MVRTERGINRYQRVIKAFYNADNMTLRLPDKWIWDFWLAQDDHDYHIFYLQAPRSLREESLRHWNVSIGHAVSSDLQHWRILPDALYPATNREAWDDFTTWTGSIIRHDGCWYLFYTGGARAEDGLVQRIGGGNIIRSDPLGEASHKSGHGSRPALV